MKGKNIFVYILAFICIIYIGIMVNVSYTLTFLPLIILIVFFLLYKFGMILLISLILLIASLLMRPMGLGQQYTPIALILTVISFGLFLVNRKFRDNIKINSKNKSLIFFTIIFWVYCGVQAIIMDSFQMSFVLKAIIINVVIISVYSTLLSNKKINKYFFKSFIMILILSSISYYITLILAKTNYESLYLFQIPIEGYKSAGMVYFPFTIGYNFTNIANVRVIRMLSIFREVGITQLFYIWAYFICDNYFRKTRLLKFTLLLGVIATWSTTGLLNLAGVFVLSIFTSKGNAIKKFFIGICVAGLVIWGLFNVQGMSIQDKAETSITDRSYAMEYGKEMFLEHPIFGVGFYNGSGIDNTGINFISSAYSIGLVGCILYFLIFIFTFTNSESKRRYMLCIAPLIITLLFSEPLIDSPFIYVLLLSNFSQIEKENKKVNTVNTVNRDILSNKCRESDILLN